MWSSLTFRVDREEYPSPSHESFLPEDLKKYKDRGKCLFLDSDVCSLDKRCQAHIKLSFSLQEKCVIEEKHPLCFLQQHCQGRWWDLTKDWMARLEKKKIANLQALDKSNFAHKERDVCIESDFSRRNEVSSVGGGRRHTGDQQLAASDCL